MLRGGGINGQAVTLDTSEEVFAGDDRFEFTELYSPRENLLTFADGQRGNHPDKIDNLKAYSPPETFRVAYVYPENFEGKQADGIWKQITAEASSLGAEPTRTVDVTYEPKERGEGTSQTAPFPESNTELPASVHRCGAPRRTSRERHRNVE